MDDVSPEGWKAIQEFYLENKGTPDGDWKIEKQETWAKGATFVNHWEQPTTLIPLPQRIKTIIWRDLSVVLGEWAKVDPKELFGSSVYGIRRYWNNSWLATHVDRGDQLVLSAIINVDIGKMEEEWPLLIHDHDENPSLVFLRPGDVVLYESAAVIHGRPLPMRGEFMANVFAHCSLSGWTYNKEEKAEKSWPWDDDLGEETDEEKNTVEETNEERKNLDQETTNDSVQGKDVDQGETEQTSVDDPETEPKHEL